MNDFNHDFNLTPQQMAILEAMYDEAVQRYYLPSWASEALDGEWVQFAQLATKDGRRMGNALILNVYPVTWEGKEVDLHTIITDFGNILELTEHELETLFHPPKWKMKANRVSHRIKFITSYSEHSEVFLD